MLKSLHQRPSLSDFLDALADLFNFWGDRKLKRLVQEPKSNQDALNIDFQKTGNDLNKSAKKLSKKPQILSQ